LYNKFYFRCKDQPNLAVASGLTRNVNSQSTEYTINVCQTGLDISDVSLDGETIKGTGNIPVTLEVSTTGCINGGEAICYYSNTLTGAGSNLVGASPGVQFFETGGLSHNQEFTGLGEGNHQIDISCIDSAGNVANSSSSFTIEVDKDSVDIARIYNSENQLTLITNEAASCIFDTDEDIGCDFELNFSESSSYGMTHTLASEIGKTYFVKCIDEYGNLPGATTNHGCSSIIEITS
jgi:hypothetical protein